MEQVAGREVLQIEASDEVKATTLVKPGKKGITNAQMIPVLRETIDAKDSAKMVLLRKLIPQVYASSIKYLDKDRRLQVETWRSEGIAL